MIPTHRGVVVAKNGVVAASQPLAVSAGLSILLQGGNCIDAAIATSAVLVVTEPHCSHLGGDAFVIFYDAMSKNTTAFNASGAAPQAANLDLFRDGIPLRGLKAASVPGLVDCWFELHQRYASFSMESLLAPAITYAEQGFPASYEYAAVMRGAFESFPTEWGRLTLKSLTGLEVPPKPGETIRQPDLAWTLSQIADGGRDAFYDGPITERIIAFSQTHGGLFTREDFANHHTQVSKPIQTDYRGYTVHGQPPVSQGMILLEELNLLEGFDLKSMGWGTADTVHVMVEAKKLAFADRVAYLGDPAFVEVPLSELLSKKYAERRRQCMNLRHATGGVQAGNLHHDTTYFCVADRDGNAVSFIQSIFHGFGCGVVAEGTGVLFNNRMNGFFLDPASPNSLAPGKRPAHTLNAYIITRGDQLAWVGGTPGGDVQVQSNFQVICNLIDFHMNPQEAIEAPRWQHSPAFFPPDSADTGLLEMEDRFPEETYRKLAARGHRVRTIGPWGHGSRYQLIAYDPKAATYFTGSDPRCEGHAAGF